MAPVGDCPAECRDMPCPSYRLPCHLSPKRDGRTPHVSSAGADLFEGPQVCEVLPHAQNGPTVVLRRVENCVALVRVLPDAVIVVHHEAKLCCPKHRDITCCVACGEHRLSTGASHRCTVLPGPSSSGTIGMAVLTSQPRIDSMFTSKPMMCSRVSP